MRPLIIALLFAASLYADSKLEAELRAENARVVAENRRLKSELDLAMEHAGTNGNTLATLTANLASTRKEIQSAKAEIVRLNGQIQQLTDTNSDVKVDAKATGKIVETIDKKADSNKALIERLTEMQKQQTASIVDWMEKIAIWTASILGGIFILISIALFLTTIYQRKRLESFSDWRNKRFIEDSEHGAKDTPADIPPGAM
jgi:chromosome segregation ATPase